MGTFQADSLHREPRGGDRTGRVRGAFGVMGKKKEGQPFRVGPLRSTAVAVPRRCIFTIAQLFGVVNNFFAVVCFSVAVALRARCPRASEVRPRPRAGGGWAPALYLHRRTGRGAAAPAVRSGRTVAQPSAVTLVAARGCTFGGDGAFRAAALPGGWVVFRADAATGRSPWERRDFAGMMDGRKSPLTIPGEVW